MKRHISYPKTLQFRNLVTDIVHQSTYIGKDENGDPIYDETLEKPVLTFTGTCKLHGTNASVCYDYSNGLWTQSRSNIITVQNDNAGFAAFVDQNITAFSMIFEEIAGTEHIDLSTHTLTVYGEWCGKGIQKGVAITNLNKAFFIFGIKVSPIDSDSEEPASWLNPWNYRDEKSRIFNVYDFQTYDIEVDFNDLEGISEKLQEFVDSVEAQCPISKAFGFDGIGEGIVWTSEYRGHRIAFKTKGEKHAKTSKTKTRKPVDLEKASLSEKIAQQVTPEWRLDQMITESCNLLNGGQIDRRHLGNYLKMVINDVYQEDSDIITNAGLTAKDVNKYISTIAREYFFEREKL